MDTRIIIKILTMAVVGGIIGYVTNVLAVKMLFRPLKPFKMPIFGFEIVGLIPKRRADIAKSIGTTVGEQLIDYDELINSMLKEEDKENLKRVLKERIAVIIEGKASFIPFLFRSKVAEFVDQVIESEFDSGIDSLLKVAKEKAISRVDVGKMVEEKINELDLVELEKIILVIASKELKHIENLGLLLGFVIGVVQGIISVTF